MPKKISEGATKEIPVRLPIQVIGIMKELEKSGLFGSSRGEVARNLILDRLKQLAAYRMIKSDSSDNGIKAEPDRP